MLRTLRVMMKTVDEVHPAFPAPAHCRHEVHVEELEKQREEERERESNRQRERERVRESERE